MPLSPPPGRYNWTLASDLAREAGGNGGIFFSSTPQQPVPRAVAYSPELLNRQWGSEAEFARFAKVAGRVGSVTNQPCILPTNQPTNNQPN